jgi:Ca2+-binding EF-hand superfamily protein
MEEYVAKRNELLHLFGDMQKISSEQLTMDHMLQFMATILDYNEQLEKLEILISSLQQYHREEIEVDVS